MTASSISRQDRHRVIAFHCSAGAPRQWRALGEALGPRFDVIAPRLVGSSPEVAWLGSHAFTLVDETAPALELMDEIGGAVHLVGHSYGGAVALALALARPDQVASLSLYEPLPMHLLTSMGQEGRDAALELRAVAHRIEDCLLVGAYVDGARAFVDYWGGRGAFDALGPGSAAAAVAYLPKVLLDFRAAFGARATLADHARIATPTLLLDGARTRRPATLLTRRLAAIIGGATSQSLLEAGHMGPVTHASDVAGLIARHIRDHAGATGQGALAA